MTCPICGHTPGVLIAVKLGRRDRQFECGRCGAEWLERDGRFLRYTHGDGLWLLPSAPEVLK